MASSHVWQGWLLWRPLLALQMVSSPCGLTGASLCVCLCPLLFLKQHHSCSFRAHHKVLVLTQFSL